MASPALRLYIGLAVTSSLLSAAFFTIAPIYRIQEAGLTPLQLVLVGTVMEATVLVFELPTGIVADNVSRKRSVVIGVTITGIAFVLEGAIADVRTILVASALWGFGWTFISGALDAWITGEVGDEQGRDAILRSRQWSRVGAMVGIVAGGGLGLVAIRLPLLGAGVLLALVGVSLLAVMPEDGFEPAPRGHTWRTTMATTFTDGIASLRGRPLLLVLLIAAVVGGMASEGFDRLWEAHFILDIGLPDLTVESAVVWIAAIRVASLLLGVASLELVRRRVDFDDHRNVSMALGAIVFMRMIGMAVFALAGGFWLALAFYFVGRQGAAAEDPIYTAWLATSVPQKVRATVLSMWGQLDAMGQVVGGPVVGIIGSRASIGAALMVSAIVLAPLVVMFLRSGRVSHEL